MIKRILMIAICLFLATHLGCATFATKAKAKNDGDPEWLEDLKAAGGVGGIFGMSREARDIEKSLASPLGR